jgi:hypothetical protein
MYIRISVIAQFVEDDELRFRQNLLALGFNQNLLIRRSNQIVPSRSSEKAREQLLDAHLAD